MQQGSCRTGATLVEVVVALVIVSISVAGAFSISSYSCRMIAVMREETRAAQAAQYQMEKWRATSWNGITSCVAASASHTPPYWYPHVSDPDSPISKLPYGQVVTKFYMTNDLASADYLRITVCTRWKPTWGMVTYGSLWVTNSMVSVFTKGGMED